MASIKRTRDKTIVYLARLVNLPPPPNPWLVLNAMLVDTPTKLEKVTMPVKNAMQGNLKRTKDKTIAKPVWWDKFPTKLVPYLVPNAMLANMATQETPGNALHAPRVSIKTPRAKPRVLPALSAQRPTMNQRRVKTHIGALAKLAKNTCMTLDHEINGNAESVLLVQYAMQILAGLPCKSWKAIGPYLGTRNNSHPLPNARFPLVLPKTVPSVPLVPWVWFVAFVLQIFIAPQPVLVILVRPLLLRHEWVLWQL